MNSWLDAKPDENDFNKKTYININCIELVTSCSNGTATIVQTNSGMRYTIFREPQDVMLEITSKKMEVF